MKIKDIGKIYRLIFGAVLILLLAVPFPTRAFGLEEVNIELAPHIISLNGSMETFVIHTQLAYGIVDPYSVTLNGDDNYIYAWKMDSLGLFDAIILLSDIEGDLIPGEENLFLLKGKTVEGMSFWGVDKILVIDKAMRPGKM